MGTGASRDSARLPPGGASVETNASRVLGGGPVGASVETNASRLPGGPVGASIETNASRGPYGGPGGASIETNASRVHCGGPSGASVETDVSPVPYGGASVETTASTGGMSAPRRVVDVRGAELVPGSGSGGQSVGSRGIASPPVESVMASAVSKQTRTDTQATAAKPATVVTPRGPLLRAPDAYPRAPDVDDSLPVRQALPAWTGSRAAYGAQIFDSLEKRLDSPAASPMPESPAAPLVPPPTALEGAAPLSSRARPKVEREASANSSTSRGSRRASPREYVVEVISPALAQELTKRKMLPQDSPSVISARAIQSPQSPALLLRHAEDSGGSTPGLPRSNSSISLSSDEGDIKDRLRQALQLEPPTVATAAPSAGESCEAATGVGMTAEAQMDATAERAGDIGAWATSPPSSTVAQHREVEPALASQQPTESRKLPEPLKTTVYPHQAIWPLPAASAPPSPPLVMPAQPAPQVVTTAAGVSYARSSPRTAFEPATRAQFEAPAACAARAQYEATARMQYESSARSQYESSARAQYETSARAQYEPPARSQYGPPAGCFTKANLGSAYRAAVSSSGAAVRQPQTPRLHFA